MSKKGNKSDTPKSIGTTLRAIRNSYVYKLISRILSILCTLLFLALLAIGGMMFYFNTKAKAASEQGLSYTPPFGLYTIISGSMEPAIHVYDVVAAVEVKDLSEIKVGDVITFVSTWDVSLGKTVTHRVIEITKSDTGEYRFTTKGDFNTTADGEPVTRNNLIGKVIFRLPQLGRLQFFLATKAGWFIVVFIPAMIVIIIDVIRIFKLKVLNVKIDDIKDTKIANRTMFDGDILDERDLQEQDLIKTHKISIIREQANVEKKEKTPLNIEANIETDKEVKLNVPEEIEPRKKPLARRNNREIQENNIIENTTHAEPDMTTEEINEETGTALEGQKRPLKTRSKGRDSRIIR